MDKHEFLKQQYISLREEIKETKARIFKTLGFGIIAVPAANFLGESYHIDVVILSLPLLVIVLAFLYLSENNAKMRCGRFIRIHIESLFKDIPGWETWLENPEEEYQTRIVDIYLDACFYILFFIYYVGSVFLETRFSIQNFHLLITAMILGFYVAIGIWFLIHLITHIQVSTTIKMDKDKLQHKP